MLNNIGQYRYWIILDNNRNSIGQCLANNIKLNNIVQYWIIFDNISQYWKISYNTGEPIPDNVRQYLTILYNI